MTFPPLTPAVQDQLVIDLRRMLESITDAERAEVMSQVVGGNFCRDCWGKLTPEHPVCYCTHDE